MRHGIQDPSGCCSWRKIRAAALPYNDVAVNLTDQAHSLASPQPAAPVAHDGPVNKSAWGTSCGTAAASSCMVPSTTPVLASQCDTGGSDTWADAVPVTMTGAASTISDANSAPRRRRPLIPSPRREG